MDILSRIGDSLQKGEDQQVGTLTAEALGEGLSAADVLQKGLIAGMNVVGEEFRQRRIFLPDVLLAARAMYAGWPYCDRASRRTACPCAARW